jgi:GTPase SAR1 family protein
MKCSKCKNILTNDAYICTKCGDISKNLPFTNLELNETFEKQLAALSLAIQDVEIPQEVMWDATVEKYARTMTKVKNMLSTEIIENQVTTKIFRDMDTLLDRCQSAEFHIALVGAIKAGKSTLINALLGYDLASTRVTPETASLTKFRSSSNGTNYVKVSFYTTTEWDKLWKSAETSRAEVFLEEYRTLDAEAIKDNWLNQEAQFFECNDTAELKEEIHKWTSSKTSTHYFVKEVEVGLKDFDMPPEVVFVDTPGLDDVVAYRSDITRDYIDRANAVLVCVKSDALTGPEMATIFSVFANTRYQPEKVYIAATQLDTLNRPETNWQEQREEWLKYLKRQDGFGSLELAEKNLIPVSGYLYSLLKNFNDISEEDDRYFDLKSILNKFRLSPHQLGENEERLLMFTGVDLLKRKLDREVLANYKTLLVNDIAEHYQMCKQDIQSLTTSIKDNQQELIDLSEKGIDEIERKRVEYEAQLAEMANDKKELVQLMKTIKNTTSQRVKELTSAINAMGGM